MTDTTYHVEGGHSLLYHRPGWLLYGVLAGKPWLGGRNWINGGCIPCPADLRPATLADFEFFRVCPEGHLTPET